MPKRTVSERINPSIFYSHIIREEGDRKKLKFNLLKCEERELDRLTENEFRANYAVEYEVARKEAEEKWYPYKDAGVIDEDQKYQYESYETDEILKERWTSLRQQVEARYLNSTILPEINQALQRREILQRKYETDWGFRVKSKGEQKVANALKYYNVMNEGIGEPTQVTLLYEPLFRIPDENRVIIPDFAIPEYCLIVEYAGLEEQRNYKIGLLMKIEAIRKLGIPLVIIRPEDLADVEKSFKQKLRFYFDLHKLEA